MALSPALLMMWSLVSIAPAKPPREVLVEEVQGAGDISANASDIPALARLLEKTGWTPTPELSGAFQPGFVFQGGMAGHRLQIEDCFSQPATRSTYTSAEVVTQLQAGVSVDLGMAGAHAGGSLVKQVKFSTPEHAAIPALKLLPSDACREALLGAAARGVDLSQLYVVQEVLTAQIAEQTCGKVDAGGRFVALGSADASLAMACAQESLEPVAIAYRTVPVLDLPGLHVSPPAPAPQPVPAPQSTPTFGPQPQAYVPPPGPSWDEEEIPLDVEPTAAAEGSTNWEPKPDRASRKLRLGGRSNAPEPAEPGDGDFDGDGLLDVSDSCPAEPEDADGHEDEDGCPDIDNDQDSLNDAIDLCLFDPEDRDAFEDEDGCPDPDNDGDGNPDASDRCPNESETINGVDDGDGCPDR